jgi:hypothetical protein
VIVGASLAVHFFDPRPATGGKNLHAASLDEEEPRIFLPRTRVHNGPLRKNGLHDWISGLALGFDPVELS